MTNLAATQEFRLATEREDAILLRVRGILHKSLWVLWLFLVVPSYHFVFAEEAGQTTGSLAGVVKDESGAPLSGVLITIDSAGETRSAASGEDGTFAFPFLAPGISILRADLKDFATITQSVEIRSGQRMNLILTMSSVLHEEIKVTGVFPRVDRSTATLTSISEELTKSLPLQRSLGDIIQMAPGVIDGRIGGANLSISGATGWENTYIVNGVNVTNPAFGGLGTIRVINQTFLPGNSLPLEAIYKTQIITAGFEPEYGESQGGVINVVTKTGGNQFHGAAHFYTTPQSEATELSDPGYEMETGAEIGGPILKNKVFFHGAYNLTASKSILFLNPEFPGYDVLPEVPAESLQHAYSLKISANLTRDHSLDFSAFGSPSHFPLSNQNGWQLDSAVDPRMAQSEWDFGSTNQQLRWSGTLSSSMLFEAQVARAYDQFVFTPTPLSKNVPRVFDQDFIDVGGFGGDTNSFSTRWQYGVKFTNDWNRHQLRYGFQYDDISYSEAFHRSGGVFVFPDGTVAENGYVINIVGDPEDPIYRVGATVPGVETQTSTKYAYAFAQDSWNLTSRLNVILGLRWEQQVLSEDRESRHMNFGSSWAPRVGATYDYLDNGTAKLFFHYGRFYERLPNYAAASLSTFYVASTVCEDSDLTDCGPVEIRLSSYFYGTGTQEFEGHENSTSPFIAKRAYSNEWSGGIEQELKGGFSFRANVIFRKLERVLDTVGLNPDLPCQPLSNGYCAPPAQKLEDWYRGSSSIFVFTNVDGHIPGIPALERNYATLQISAQKRFSQQWQLLGSYAYARLTGNYTGDDRSGVADFGVSPMAPFTYISGPLENDIRHVVKVFGSYSVRNLTSGVAFHFQTGRPVTRMMQVWQSAFAATAVLQEPRGASGRTDSISNVDLHADYRLPFFRDQRISIGADLFNVFNTQGVTAIDELEFILHEDGGVEFNETYLQPVDIQPGRSIRLLLRYTF